MIVSMSHIVFVVKGVTACLFALHGVKASFDSSRARDLCVEGMLARLGLVGRCHKME